MGRIFPPFPFSFEKPFSMRIVIPVWLVGFVKRMGQWEGEGETLKRPLWSPLLSVYCTYYCIRHYCPEKKKTGCENMWWLGGWSFKDLCIVARFRKWVEKEKKKG